MTSGKTFQNLSPEKQERITRIAAEEFGEKGFDGASINVMVDRMGIAKGSIFQYFGDKKGLFRFVFTQSVEMVKGYLRTVRDQSIHEPLPVRLEKTLAAGVDFIKSHPLLYRLYIKVLSESRVPFREEMLLSLRQYSIGYLKSLLDQACANGEIQNAVDTKRAAFILDAVMDRFLQAHTLIHLDGGLGIYNAPSDATDEWIKDMVGMICQGIEKTFDSPSKPASCILILAAVDEELAALGARIEKPLPMQAGRKKIISGTLAGREVLLMATGPGMINTAQSLTAVIEFLGPELIIQTGCAGAFRESGIAIGDVGIAVLEINAQSGLESPDGSPLPDPLPFSVLKDGQTEYKNHYPLNDSLASSALEILKADDCSKDFQVRKGAFVTVSTITATDLRAKLLFDRFGPCMEQMEGAAAAHIALLYDIPFLEIRAASNFVGKRDKNEWNLTLAFQNACSAVASVVTNADRLKRSDSAFVIGNP